MFFVKLFFDDSKSTQSVPKSVSAYTLVFVLFCFVLNSFHLSFSMIKMK